jgi:competence protein ComEC
VGVKRSSFELARWLEHDGDARTVQEAGGASGFFCDAVGCRTRVKGLTVAQRPAAFADDCRRASILVASIVSPKSCSAPKAVVDFFAARREGTHGLDDGRVRVETVAQARGARPWSELHSTCGRSAGEGRCRARPTRERRRAGEHRPNGPGR